MSTGPYAQAAGDYWAADWKPLPLPPRSKELHLRGYTGNDGDDPTWPDVAAWTDGHEGRGNIALRLPDNVLGLDIDDYDNKPGAATLASGERVWGPLPATWRTTSRDDGISGIRLYRVPPGLRWPGGFGPGTETIRRGHRYAVAPPSIHPEGRTYRWITPSGAVSLHPPRPRDLPELPTTWVVGLTQNRTAVAYQEADMDDSEVREWLVEHSHGEPCDVMVSARDELLGDMRGGAHESLRLLMRVVGSGAAGHDGLTPALKTVHDAFVATVRARRGGTDIAEDEWRRSLGGAVRKVVGEMAKTNTRTSRIDPCADSWHAPGMDVFAWDDDEVLDSPAPAATATTASSPLSGDVLSAPAPGSADDASEAPSDDISLDSPAGDVPSDEGGSEGSTPEQVEERYIEHELQLLRRRETAKQRLAAEQAPELRRLSARAFREAPRPQALVPGVFYKDSLARVYGAPGCGKSFLAMDLAMHVALGRSWRGEAVERGRVFYVMAEGQAVNVLRAEAWCERNEADFDELEGWFDAFPDALSLTESAVREFVAECRRDQPALVILDTKNAMMVGEENSASDFAVMRRALDAVRKACGACVVLIDHTGYEGTRARGTSAATAGMDTELHVEKNDDRPAMITAKVTRDKAAEIGQTWAWHLRMAGEAAALVAIEGYVEGDEDRRVDDGPEAWRDAHIPTELLDIEGSGKKSLPDLARLMAYDANQRAGDPAGVGMTRQEAFKVLEAHGHDKTSVRRAWSRLIDMGYLEPAEGVKAAHLRHLWAY